MQLCRCNSSIDRCDVVCESTTHSANKVSLFFIVGFSSRVMSLADLFAVSFSYSLTRARQIYAIRIEWCRSLSLWLNCGFFFMRSIIPLVGFNSIYRNILQCFWFGSLIRAIITMNNWIESSFIAMTEQTSKQMSNGEWSKLILHFVHSFIRSVHWIVIQISYLRFWLIY